MKALGPIERIGDYETRICAVLTHFTRLVFVGDSDTSFLSASEQTSYPGEGVTEVGIVFCSRCTFPK